MGYRYESRWLPWVRAWALAAGLVLVPPSVLAAKVKLDPSNWGHPAGENCASCHAKSSAGLHQQWLESAHAKAGVNCMDCHQAAREDADAIEHEGQVIATIVSPKDCGRCHTTEYEEQKGSVHAEAVSLIARYQEHPLRTLDALHLAVARHEQVDAIATADGVMADTAEAMGFAVARF
jgi:mono/diheme cytochrome c family protein